MESSMFKVEGTAVVNKANVGDDDKPLPISPKEEFDPNIIVKGLVDNPIEGGISVARSTGTSGMSDMIPGAGLGFKGCGEGPYELCGFTARYTIPETTDVGTVEVSKNFGSIDMLKETITGTKYIHTTPKGVKVDCDIVLGAPCICVNECEKFRYVDGTWVRS